MGTTNAKLVIHLPPVSDDQVSRDLRWLTELLLKRGAETTGGLLGGEFGYGAEFENDVFEMHPYYWGDCECGFEEADTTWCNTHGHTADCYQQVIRSRGFLDVDVETTLSYKEKSAHNLRVTAQVCAEMGLDPEHGCYVHCTCSHEADYAAWREANGHDSSCGIERPNFLHKASGTRVDFYKYIGRGMEVDLKAEWRDVLADCVASLDSARTP